MISAQEHPKEEHRLAELLKYEILDTEDEQCFDELTELASIICGTPISLISLVDDHRQWFKSRVGLDATETDKNIAFCSHAILQDHIFEVPNALEDSRFVDNPLVTDAPNIRFYAGAPLTSKEGFPLGTLCVIDRESKKLSTEQRKALTTLAKQVVSQLELRLHAKRAERLSTEREKLYAILAHDLRSPFNGILGLSRALAQSAEQLDTSKIKAYSNEILNTSLNLYQILDEILQWSQECIGHTVCKLGNIKLLPAIEECLTILKEPLKLKNLRVNLSVASDLSVYADSTLLKTVLRNLISNAIKYSPANSEVEVTAEAKDNMVEVAVADHGAGIPISLRSKLFKSSVASKTGTEGELGHGLGLSLAGDFMLRQNGKIWIDEHCLSGTRIVITLPQSSSLE